MRSWIAQLCAADELQDIKGAEREKEIGGIVDIYQRKIGNKAYKTSATMTVLLPMPPINGMGIRKPNRARLGIVCMTLANPSIHFLGASCLVR